MKKTVSRLADGRQIIYFDEDDAAARELVDLRDLPPVTSRSEVRYDPLLGEWVVLASHRQGRTHLPPVEECPLCPSTGDRLTEIPSADYDVAIFENRFASLDAATDAPSHADLLDGLCERRPGTGRCEVVCFTSDHGSSFAQLTPQRVRTVMEAWADRSAELGALDDVEYVFVFENRGREIGVTLHHPHGQIYAYPFVPPRARQILDSARRYRDRTSRNLFADVLAREQEDGERVVARSQHWTAFVPAAARWPVEVHVYPHRQVPDLGALTDRERDDFAGLYLDVLRRCDALFGQPLPYVAAWHQAPVETDRDLAYLHLQLFSVRRAPGKLKYLAGSESAMGAFIGDVLPEDTARRLREVPGAPGAPGAPEAPGTPGARP
jgi:UDPglucose--hexose-1-phosphate uridylyltransferase